MNLFPFTISFWIIIFLIMVAGFTSYITGRLTLSATVTGVLTAILVYFGTGLTGVSMLAVFFISGSAATSFKKEYKVKMRLSGSDDGRRRMSQVLANAGAAAILSLLGIIMEHDRPMLQLMVAGSFASATGDTFASEFGNLYGRNFYNILNLKKDERGLNGVISLEGTVFGIFGSLIIALIYIITSGWSLAFFVIVIAGIAGNLCDSLLGALFERRGYLGNEAVNFINTAFAAMIVLILMQ